MGFESYSLERTLYETIVPLFNNSSNSTTTSFGTYTPFFFNTTANSTLDTKVGATDAWFFYISLVISIIVAAVLAYALLRYYTSQNKKFVSWFLYVPLFLNYTFLFSSVSLITLDVSLALTSSGVLPDTALEICWYIIYFSLQILSWIVLPILQNYAYTGEFTFYGKFIRSVLSHIITYSILGIIAGVVIVIFVIFLVIADKTLLSFSFLINVGVALSNLFGLILFSIFLGYGIVKMPRTLWRKSNVERIIKWNCIESTGKRSKMKKEERALAEMVVTVREVSKIVTKEHKLYWYIDAVSKTCDSIIEEFPKLQKVVNSIELKDCTNYNKQTFDKFLEVGSLQRLCPEESKKKTCTRSTCVKIHAEIQRAMREYRANRYEWENTLNETFYLQDVIRCCTYPSNHPLFKREIVSDFRPMNRFWRTYLYFYYRFVHWIYYKVLATVAVSFAIVILYSEFAPSVFSLAEETGTSIFYEIIQRCVKTGSSPLIQIVSLLMVVCIILLMLGGMFKVRLFKIFKMVPSYTDTYSLYFSASLICRAVPSLCYNFLLLLDIKQDDGVAFFSAVGILDFRIFPDSLGGPIIGDLITNVLKQFPMILIVLVCILSFFRVFERIAGFKKYRWRTFYCWDTIPAELMENGLILLRQKRKSKREKIIAETKQQEKLDIQNALSSTRNPNNNVITDNPILNASALDLGDSQADYQQFNQETTENKI
ncbi:predicted protein [Naegleria gruberi]|uniref:Predicted protein n=1 Tax=Naegleria gruberi TaxID=5762 RepID=D2V0X4_NAEGR|nr:uncharacterized protein NAEGRDRAFT_62448 [Naegleria gruberi]EFC49803.1 predicted protein [Naegleria gruberi]|eukprot:XP_002682547.1 predicted protein [Naegleria gruberi strain NEG-M]